MIKINNKGLTLLEVLVAMGIFALLVGGIIGLLSYSLRSNKIIWEQLSTQNEGRKVVQDFVNELRSASYSSIGAYPLASTTNQQIMFYSNIDTDSLRERVRYFLNSTTLKKGILKPSSTPLVYNPVYEVITEIAHDVINSSTPVFYYYDQNYGSTATSTALTQPVNATAVRTVGIKLILEENPTASPEPFNVEAKVEVRNLKSN